PAVAGDFAILAGYAALRVAAFPHAFRQDQFTFAVIGAFAARQLEYLHFLIPVLPGPIVLLLDIGALFVLRRWRPVLFFGPWWHLVSVAPLIVTYSSARHLDLASVGLCMLIAALLPRRWFWPATAALTIGAAVLLVRQNLEFRFVAAESARAQREIE